MTYRSIEAFGHSIQGSFVDFASNPVALLVSPHGDIFLGAGALPGLPVDGLIPRAKVQRFSITPSTTLGAGWVLELTYQVGDKERTLPVGLWKGAYSELRDWFVRVSDIIGVPTKASRSTTSSAISRILKRKKLLAVPAWALSSASGVMAQEYKRGWMQPFLEYVCRILTVRYGLTEELTYAYADRTPQETWLPVFSRLTPRIADRKPSRAIDVCFEPLFLSPPREGTFDIVAFGWVLNFVLVYRGSNPRMLEFEQRMGELRPTNETESTTNDPDSSMADAFDRTLKLLADTAFAPAGANKSGRGPPLRILSQIGTISDELVSDLVASGDVEHASRLQAVDIPRLVAEMSKTQSFVLFCDEILLGDVLARWKETEHEALEVQPFPLPQPIPAGLPFAAGDTEWGAILREALLAVANSEDPKVRESWGHTVAEFEDIHIEVESEFRPKSLRQHA